MLLTQVKAPAKWSKIVDVNLANLYTRLMSTRPAQGTGRLGLRTFRINTLYSTCDVDQLLERGTFFKGVDANEWNSNVKAVTLDNVWPHGGFFTTDVLRAATYIGGRHNPPRIGLKGALLLCDRLSNMEHVTDSGYNDNHNKAWPSDYRSTSASILGFMYVEHTGL